MKRGRKEWIEDHKCTFIVNKGMPLIALKFNRNEICPCGSGKKRKYCHGANARYYNTEKKVPQLNEAN